MSNSITHSNDFVFTDINYKHKLFLICQFLSRHSTSVFSHQSVFSHSSATTAPYHPCGDGPPTIHFQDLSSESPPVGWSLSTRSIRNYVGGGPDSSRDRETPQHARWAEHKRMNPKVECATRVLRLLQWVRSTSGISGYRRLLITHGFESFPISASKI